MTSSTPSVGETISVIQKNGEKVECRVLNVAEDLGRITLVLIPADGQGFSFSYEWIGEERSLKSA
jgi:hypothetical protein